MQVDMGVREEECARVVALKDQFSKDKGYFLYGRGDYIPQRAK